MVDHYAWERYQVVIGDTVLCLKCAAKQYFSDPKNWIDPKLVKSVVVEPYDPRKNGTNTPLFSPRTGVLNVARSPHVLGVKQPLPRGIAFVENAEFDRMEGHQISGRSLLGVIRELNQPFAPVLDAGWQFAVSIGIYVRSGAGAALKERLRKIHIGNEQLLWKGDYGYGVPVVKTSTSSPSTVSQLLSATFCRSSTTIVSSTGMIAFLPTTGAAAWYLH